MRYPGAEQTDSPTLHEAAIAGPSSVGINHPPPSNGHLNGNGFTSIITNGAAAVGNGVQKHNGHSKQASAASHSLSIARVMLPGTSLYDDDRDVDREEFVRLVIQSLRDVGYIESAATLEAESGYAMESPEVAEFRQYIMEARWSKAENALQRLGVRDHEGLLDARFLISQQKYLELLEAQRTTDALHVLRNELAPLDVESEQLHMLSSLMMCSEPEDLRQRAGWDGAAGHSRRMLLDSLHRYIPPSIMVPPRRFSTLLHQANAYQRQQCVYHNIPSSPTGFSLFADHQCDKTGFPRVTTTILEVHADQVWMLEWSRDGNFLASASSDKSVIIWGIGPETEATPIREWEKRHMLNHPYPVISMAWSLDDSILLAGTEHHIKMWNAKTGVCIRTLEEHSEPVTALVWLPDDSGFFSAGMDFKIVLWNPDGSRREMWTMSPVRVANMVLTPDCTRLVAIGMKAPLPMESRTEGESAGPGANGGVVSSPPPKDEHRLLVFDIASKRNEISILFEGELTSLSVSQNSQYALVSRSPDDIQLWDLSLGRLVRKYTGQRQSKDIIRSCFGGFESNFVVSGSEDGNVYVWHRDTGVLLEVLEGHGDGSVNCVAWNPRNERMFASCSDDRTIRIWESPDILPDSPAAAEHAVKGKGKTRQRDDGADASSTRT
ncbi:WD40-repeat-containing domain protein [Mycena pura]|uniref:WD40-repeat-containing domain protein n=1 Tax=Mycena pura TaxID=153505 RepID=A0AAD6VQ62_9AGAR|nr:WD40-repeat-containing domain protein [Mycena pura]